MRLEPSEVIDGATFLLDDDVVVVVVVVAQKVAPEGYDDRIVLCILFLQEIGPRLLWIGLLKIRGGGLFLVPWTKKKHGNGERQSTVSFFFNCRFFSTEFYWFGRRRRETATACTAE